MTPPPPPRTYRIYRNDCCGNCEYARYVWLTSQKTREAMHQPRCCLSRSCPALFPCLRWVLSLPVVDVTGLCDSHEPATTRRGPR